MLHAFLYFRNGSFLLLWQEKKKSTSSFVWVAYIKREDSWRTSPSSIVSYQRIDWIVIKKRTKNFHLCTECTTIIIIFFQPSKGNQSKCLTTSWFRYWKKSYRQAFKTNEKLFYLYILIKRKEKRNDLMEEEEGVRWKRMLINFRRWPGRKKRKRDGYPPPPIIASSFVFDSALRVYASSLHWMTYLKVVGGEIEILFLYFFPHHWTANTLQRKRALHSAGVIRQWWCW